MDINTFKGTINSEIATYLDSLRESINQTEQDLIVIREQYKAALEQGDLRENAEYTAAVESLATKNRLLSILYKKVDALEQFTQNVPTPGTIGVYSCVHIIETTSGGIDKFVVIVPEDCDIPEKGLIAENCPVAVALISKTVGDVVSVVTQTTDRKYKITEVL